MRSKVTKKIIASTPDEIRESVREQANEMANSAHSYTEGADIIESLKSENARLRQAYDYILASRNSVDKELVEKEEQNDSLKQSLRELIEDFRAVESTWIRRAYGMGSDYWGSDEEQNIRKSINRAKSKLTN